MTATSVVKIVAGTNIAGADGQDEAGQGGPSAAAYTTATVRLPRHAGKRRNAVGRDRPVSGRERP